MKQILAWGCDIALIAFGAIAALRFTTEWPIPQPMVLMLFVALIAGFATTVFRTVGVYRSWRARPIISLAVRLIAAWSSVQLAGWIFLSVSDRPVAITGTWVLLWTALTGFALVAVRVLVYSALRRLRFIGTDVRAVAVVGSGVHFRRLLRSLTAAKRLAFMLLARSNCTFRMKMRAVQSGRRVPAHSKVWFAWSNQVKFRKSGLRFLWSR